MTAPTHDDREPDLDESDDDALSWGSSSDPSHLDGAAHPDRALDLDDPDDDDSLPDGVMGSGLLVVHGVFGALYILFTVAWLVAVGRTAAPSLVGVSLALWHLGQYLAVLASPLWFVATLLLTPIYPARRRLLWLVAGLVVLIPWPFLVGGVQ